VGELAEIDDLVTVASIVIPAHNEAAVIERCLRALFDDAGLETPGAGPFEVVVACNGCTDGTADVVRGTGLPVTVIEVAAASKLAALRAGDETATVFPRVYLDADVVVAGSALRAVARRLGEGDVLAARPPLRYDAAGASRLVRRYYLARSRLPEVLNSLWGAGVYAVSAAGHARIRPWPEVIADDLYVDRCFTADEIEIVDCAPVTVRVPLRSTDLLAVLGRTYQGKAQTAEKAQPAEKSTLARTLGGLLRLVLHHPSHALDAAVYAGFAVAARIRRRAVGDRVPWARDDSSRTPA
jgi:hypothetical protein